MIGMQGTPSDEWYECFPVEHTGRILYYVSSSWADLCSSFPDVHHAGESEPNLTKSLSDHLDDAVRRRSAGIGGRFHSERAVNARDAKGRRRQVSRTDIEYHLPRSGRAALVMEFKKLQGTSSWRRHYRKKGMLKFVNGAYAPTEECGVMCGLISCDYDVEIAALAESISRCRRELWCIDSIDGSSIVLPSTIAPGIAEFDTHHTRAAPNAGGQIRLIHLFLVLRRSG